MPRTTIMPGRNVRSVLGEMTVEPWVTEVERVGRPPFVAISRQPGAGGVMLGRELVELLNEGGVAGGGWTLWDDEIVAKVASDNHLTTELIRGLEEGSRPRSWLLDFVSSLPGERGPADTANEVWIYHRIADMIQTLAATGKVVIVGHGSVRITQKIIHGVRVRLVAPLKWRVNFIAHHLDLSPQEARNWVRSADRHWEGFYRKFWRGGAALDPESVAATLNAAELSIPEMAEAIGGIVVRRMAPVRGGGNVKREDVKT